MDYNALGEEAYLYIERGLNVSIRDFILTYRYMAERSLSIDQIIRLERLANKYRDLRKTITPEMMKFILKQIQRITKH